MPVRVSGKDLSRLKADLAVCFAYEGDREPRGITSATLRRELAAEMKAEAFKAGPTDKLAWNTKGRDPARRFLVVGLGPQGEVPGLEERFLQPPRLPAQLAGLVESTGLLEPVGLGQRFVKSELQVTHPAYPVGLDLAELDLEPSLLIHDRELPAEQLGFLGASIGLEALGAATELVELALDHGLPKALLDLVAHLSQLFQLLLQLLHAVLDLE